MVARYPDFDGISQYFNVLLYSFLFPDFMLKFPAFVFSRKNISIAILICLWTVQYSNFPLLQHEANDISTLFILDSPGSQSHQWLVHSQINWLLLTASPSEEYKLVTIPLFLIKCLHIICWKCISKMENHSVCQSEWYIGNMLANEFEVCRFKPGPDQWF